MDGKDGARYDPNLNEHPINYSIGVGDLAFANQFGSISALPVTLLLLERDKRHAHDHYHRDRNHSATLTADAVINAATNPAPELRVRSD
jgi:hypothetical protein